MTSNNISIAYGVTQRLKVAVEQTRELLGLCQDAVLRERLVDLQARIVEAEEIAFKASTQEYSLQKRILLLEEQIQKLDSWESEKGRYELIELGDDRVAAYGLKAEFHTDGESRHLCATCYQSGRKSVLQRQTKMVAMDSLVCHSCKTEILVGLSRPVAAGQSRR